MTSNDPWFQKIMDASGHASTVHGCNALAQVAATAALNECPDWLNAFVAHLQNMRNLSLKELETIPGFSCLAPQGCYLLFCNIEKTGLNSSELQQLLFEEAKVAVVPGLPRWFGEKAEGHVRICFSTSEVLLKEAFGRIRAAMREKIG
jgi:bifunctional pyridoxal-dependent enzyme with beta-cystathionase and maltose regulon repressor activities